MNPNERAIAEAAVKVAPAITYENIYKAVSLSTGINIDEVAAVMKHLSAEGYLKQCGGPAHIVNAGERVGENAKGWYERGGLWKD